MITYLTTRLPSAIILKLVYGYTMESEGKDPLSALSDETMGAAFPEGLAYGAYIVDLIPLCMLHCDYTQLSHSDLIHSSEISP